MNLALNAGQLDLACAAVTCSRTLALLGKCVKPPFFHSIKPDEPRSNFGLVQDSSGHF